MVIKEKELARLMKDAYRGGGYTVAVRGNGKTVICTNAWAVEIDDASLPREALSMMALHMGFLPEPDEAFTIYKGNKEPTVQTKDFDVAVQCITQLDALLEKLAEEGKDASFIALYYGEDVTEEAAQAAGARFQAVCPNAEISVLPGGQPVYYYIISFE